MLAIKVVELGGWLSRYGQSVASGYDLESQMVFCRSSDKRHRYIHRVPVNFERTHTHTTHTFSIGMMRQELVRLIKAVLLECILNENVSLLFISCKANQTKMLFITIVKCEPPPSSKHFPFTYTQSIFRYIQISRYQMVFLPKRVQLILLIIEYC